MKYIYVNGRFLTQSITGVQRYATELIKAWDDLYEKNLINAKHYHIEILLPDYGALPAEIRELKHVKVRKIGFLRGHLWEQLELPFYVGKGVLFSPCNTAPVLSLLNMHQHVVTTVHDLSYRYYPEAYSFLFRMTYTLLMPIVLKFSSSLITVSFSEKKMIEKYYPSTTKKLVAIYHGVSLDFFHDKDGLRNSRFDVDYILYVGSLSKRKNIQGVIDAYRILRKVKKVSLVIVGATSNSFVAGSLFLPDTVKDNIIFYGHVEELSELTKLYSRARCLLFPSFYESFGFPAVEAMSCGCPVVVSRTTCLPEICEDAGTYCSPHDVEDIANKACQLIDNSSYREEKVRLSLNRARYFSWKKCALETLQVIDKGTE